MATKKQLLHLLESIYNTIPECTCSETIIQADGRPDPTCHRHGVFPEPMINYIRITIGNAAVRARAEAIEKEDRQKRPF